MLPIFQLMLIPLPEWRLNTKRASNESRSKKAIYMYMTKDNTRIKLSSEAAMGNYIVNRAIKSIAVFASLKEDERGQFEYLKSLLSKLGK